MDTKRRELMDNLINELREMPNGSVTTMRGLLEAAGVSPDPYCGEQLQKLYSELAKEAAESRIYFDTDGSDFDDRRFMVYNAGAGVKCPRCGGTNTARILYGVPGQDQRIRQKIEQGRLIHGSSRVLLIPMGDGMVMANATRKCSDCGKQFGRPAMIIARDFASAEPYQDAVTSIEFVMIGSAGESTRIRIRKNGQGAQVELTESRTLGQAGIDRPVGLETGIAPAAAEPLSGPDSAGEPMTGQITSEKWERILDTLFRRLHLHEWNKGYDNLFMPDAPRWKLKLRLTGRRVRNYHGSVAMTPYYKELLNLMLQIF